MWRADLLDGQGSTVRIDIGIVIGVTPCDKCRYCIDSTMAEVSKEWPGESTARRRWLTVDVPILVGCERPTLIHWRRPISTVVSVDRLLQLHLGARNPIRTKFSRYDRSFDLCGHVIWSLREQ